MTSSDSKVTKVETHFKALSSIASSLNTASDELTKTVVTLDEALKKLNIGLTVWVTFSSRAVEDWEYDAEQIGYTKVQSKWGIALRHIWGDDRADVQYIDGPWLFNDAPRDMRIGGVDGIPELIEALAREAIETTKRVRDKTHAVRELAGAIEQIANTQKKGTNPLPPPPASAPPTGPCPENHESVMTTGFSAEQLLEILAAARHRHILLAELLGYAVRWQLNHGDLRIYFPADKRPFAEMVEGRELLPTITSIAREVLGHPVQVVVKLDPPIIGGSDKGGK